MKKYIFYSFQVVALFFWVATCLELFDEEPCQNDFSFYSITAIVSTILFLTLKTKQ